jgi:hypothetical protein
VSEFKVPNGWKLVPEEPTREMLVAGVATNGVCPIYSAMLAAAPIAQAEQQPVGEIILFGGDSDLKEVSWRKGKMPEVGAKLYAAPPVCMGCVDLSSHVRELEHKMDYYKARAAPSQPEQSGLVEALEAIVRQYPNPDISHVDYRVHACKQAEHALEAYRAALSDQGGAE